VRGLRRTPLQTIEALFKVSRHGCQMRLRGGSAGGSWRPRGGARWSAFRRPWDRPGAGGGTGGRLLVGWARPHLRTIELRPPGSGGAPARGSHRLSSFRSRHRTLSVSAASRWQVFRGGRRHRYSRMSLELDSSGSRQRPLGSARAPAWVTRRDHAIGVSREEVASTWVLSECLLVRV
jgi:hypothetical protein